ncbi:hypothetical protein [Hymenobacter cellulosilyticus]|uniref:Uncharacterized protein n=1 Tax=Hymenobacter cellulosilyticus TaxID=2932248 RepID=A0A8T9QEP1_9BACT|nr:hypothetical protein [Hymenobacter cellulosilyticus]UOQ75312.1 hypothetical protein MUN79_29430 [Hymenobacter cellulosilyticus]
MYSRDQILGLLQESLLARLPFPEPTALSLWQKNSDLKESTISRTEELLGIPVRVAARSSEQPYQPAKEKVEPFVLFLADQPAVASVEWGLRIYSARQPLPASLVFETGDREVVCESESRIWSGLVRGLSWTAQRVDVDEMSCAYAFEPKEIYLLERADIYSLPDWVETSDWQTERRLLLLCKDNLQNDLEQWAKAGAQSFRQLRRRGLPSNTVSMRCDPSILRRRAFLPEHVASLSPGLFCPWGATTSWRSIPSL